MDSAMPRSVIPPAWAQQGSCPVCQAAKLSVRQTPGAPDQIACAQCGCAFELEAGGSRLAFTQGPPAVAPATGGAARKWLSISEVRALLQRPPAGDPVAPVPAPSAAAPQAQAATPPPPEVQPPTAAPAAVPGGLARCTEAELTQRAETLLGLGNSPLQIRVALVQSGVDPALVEKVVEAIQRLAHQKRQQELRWTWLLAGLVIICLAIVTGGGWLWWHRAAGGNPSAARATQPSGGGPSAAGTSQPPGSAPGAAETSLPPKGPPTPTGVAGFLLSLPTSVVQTEPPPKPGTGGARPASRCPTTSNEAADLFGGQASDWTYKADAGGWLMTAITPKTITVPAGMMAGYLQFGSGGANMNQVNGPAKIQNVNFIAITCP